MGQDTAAPFRPNPWIGDKPLHHITHAVNQVQPQRITPENVSEVLAPLAYLQAIPPPRRHPLDEKALMSFAPGRA